MRDKLPYVDSLGESGVSGCLLRLPIHSTTATGRLPVLPLLPTIHKSDTHRRPPVFSACLLPVPPAEQAVFASCCLSLRTGVYTTLQYVLRSRERSGASSCLHACCSAALPAPPTGSTLKRSVHVYLDRH